MIQLGIVGLGRWGQNLVNSVQNKSTDVKFIKGCVRNTDKVSEFGKAVGIELTSRYEDLIEDPRIDGIVLATPHTLHVPQIVAAAQAGKGILCEKPLALTKAEAQIAIDACQKAGVILGVGHDKRFWPATLELKKIVESKVLGELLHIEGNFSNENSKITPSGWRQDKENVPGATLTATGIHVVDTFTNMMGPISKVSGFFHDRKGQETMDSMAMTFQFKSGATGVLSSVRPTPVFWRIHVFGNKGSAEAHGANVLNLQMSGKPLETIRFEPRDALKFQLEVFAHALANKKPYPISFEEILQTVEAFEAAARAIDTQTTVSI
ncbi:MAG: Gfo/Idh/MocA family oxidoreductase [Betaproteobacteria bacterium]|jgi:predicted dehydrogenase